MVQVKQSMVCVPMVDNPLAEARELSFRTGAQIMLYLSLVHAFVLLDCLQ